MDHDVNLPKFSRYSLQVYNQWWLQGSKSLMKGLTKLYEMRTISNLSWKKCMRDDILNHLDTILAEWKRSPCLSSAMTLIRLFQATKNCISNYNRIGFPSRNLKLILEKFVPVLCKACKHGLKIFKAWIITFYIHSVGVPFFLSVPISSLLQVALL